MVFEILALFQKDFLPHEEVSNPVKHPLLAGSDRQCDSPT